MKTQIERMFQLRDVLEKTSFNVSCLAEVSQDIEDILYPRETGLSRIEAALKDRAHAFGMKVY